MLNNNACTCKVLPLWIMGLSRMANKKTVRKRKMHIFNSMLKAWKCGMTYRDVSIEYDMSRQRVNQIFVEVVKKIFPKEADADIQKRITIIRRFLKNFDNQKVCVYCNNSELFYSYINVNFFTGCWIWNGTMSGKHYGAFGKKYAHRLSYEIYNGAIPDGLCVCHTCDTPLCVNPKHLWIGSRADNAHDRHKKGRTNVPKGNTHPRAILTEIQVLEIRNKAKPFICTQRELAKKYNVSKDTIKAVLDRKTWKHVTE